MVHALIIIDSGDGEKDREKDIYTEYTPVGLFLLDTGLKRNPNKWLQ